LWGVKNRLNRNPGPAPVGGSGGWISSCCCCSPLISYACCWSKFWTSGCGIKNDVEDITGPRQILTLFKGWLATVASWDDTPRTRTTSSKLETGHWTLIPYYWIVAARSAGWSKIPCERRLLFGVFPICLFQETTIQNNNYKVNGKIRK